METLNNIQTLYVEIGWLEKVIDQSIRSYLMQEGHERNWEDISLPDLAASDSPYATMVKNGELNVYERLALALGLAAHMRPESLDIFFGKNQMYDRSFTEFGGRPDTRHCGFLPTIQTFYFVVGPRDPNQRAAALAVLHPENKLMREQVLQVGKTEDQIPASNGILSLSKRWFQYFLTGELIVEGTEDTPFAGKLTTELDWSDVILSSSVMNEIKNLEAWITHGDEILRSWGLAKKIKPGYRAFFYGASGTGKTLAATLLGKSTGQEVCRVSLPTVISEYIGETEKNLSRVFEQAQRHDWILFFDEADALFGRRTEVQDAHDRYANQEVSYLLQRIEIHPGVVILAANEKPDFDDAFYRRFQSVVHFPMPTPRERYQLWRQVFAGEISLDTDIDLERYAETFELNGGQITEVVRYCALQAAQAGETVVREKDLRMGIARVIRRANIQ